MLRWMLLVVMLLALPGWAQESTVVRVGQKVPNFTLTDQFGKAVQLYDFKGKVVLVTFLYTQCPYPEKCAMLADKLAKTRKVVDAIGAHDALQVLSITVDPQRDTPERLKKYAQGRDRDAPNWSFLTGTPNDVAKVAALFGMMYWTEKNGNIEHNMRTGIIDKSGKLAKVITGNDFKPGELAAVIRDQMQK